MSASFIRSINLTISLADGGIPGLGWHLNPKKINKIRPVFVIDHHLFATHRQQLFHPAAELVDQGCSAQLILVKKINQLVLTG